MRVARRKVNGERGAALLESAMTMLTLFVFIFGIMEACRLLSFQETLANAAREGARFAVLPLPGGGRSTKPTDSDIQTKVNQYLNAASVNSGSATIVITHPTVTTGSIVTELTSVSVTAPYRIMTISMFRDLEVNLRGVSTMRDETSP
jgi:Flp pilus assembly protein TadG